MINRAWRMGRSIIPRNRFCSWRMRTRISYGRQWIAVSIEYRSLPAIFTIEDSERHSQIIWGDDNTFKTFFIAKGDVDSCWAKADYIVEGEYTTGAQEQLYIENNGVIAAFDREQGITVWGSLQCPYYVHKALMALCNLPADKIRVVQTGNGRRVRRQGRLSLDDCGPCVASRP